MTASGGINPLDTEANLQAIIDRVRSKYPAAKIVLAGMRVPTNLGPEFGESFQAIYPDLAKKNAVTLIPFLLEGVGGRPELNQADGMHPTPDGAKIVAEGVWKSILPMLNSRN